MELTEAQKDANYRELVRVTSYALEDVQTLDAAWFVHDNGLLEHTIERNGECFPLKKSHYSNYDPTLIGYDLGVPQITMDGSIQVRKFGLWVAHPKADADINRQAVTDALRKLISNRVQSSAQVDIDSFYARRL